MLIDTHCHLDAAEFDQDRDAVISRMQAAGIFGLVLPAVQVADFSRVQQLAHANKGFAYALGIHPLFVDRSQEEDLDALETALQACRDDPALVAVGEIGLDHFVEGLDRAKQERFFDHQLRLALKFGLPVILHVRRAQDTVLKYLRRRRPLTGIAHAFNGSVQQAAMFLNLGFALGFGGAMTFERSLRIRSLVASLPPEGMVLETDSPDISPAWLHPARNEPAELQAIAACMAQLRGISIEQLASRTADNVFRVLPRMSGLLSAGAKPAT